VNDEVSMERQAVQYDTHPPLIDDAIVVTGPTASGKSSVGLALAKLLTERGRPAEIVSLDSIAVYRGMDIGTAKPSVDDQCRVRHHLIDVVEPTEDYSVARYMREAHQIVRTLLSSGRTPIFVGGTPMFLKGVLRGFDPGPPADWQFRQSVEQDLERYGIAALHARLRQIDPLAAHKIAPTDARRMIRALEVSFQTSMPISHRQIQFEQQRDRNSCHVFSLQWPRARLHERINERVDRMFAAGLVNEVRCLLDQHGSLSRTASQAVGYREIIAAIGAQQNPIESKPIVAAHTRQMARRQETWFRSFSEIRAVPVTEPFDAPAVAAQITNMII
jgi:tRNA dimethylallyltransferase